MEFLLLSIHPGDPLWIAIAFMFGFLVKQIGLPPLTGFLFSGFLLNALGATGGEFLSTTADMGITLLLFSIGLKLRIKSFIRPQIWAVATLHMAVVSVLIAALILMLAKINVPLFIDLDSKTALLVGFALSFSSTVFAVKVLDELGATHSAHGGISIGVLVIQDLAAVIFLAVSMAKLPSIWALSLFLLIPGKYILFKILDRSGHGELLILFGITLALGGADIFELVGMKGDVGALVLGMLMASHAKSNELAKALLSFKDLFLVGFFLSVGMTSLPGWNELMIALIFIAFLPLKVAIYFGLFNVFSLRASTSWRSSLNLANYSEFGLIVGALAISSGWLASEWLAIFAIVLALSFILSAPLTGMRDKLYRRWRQRLKLLERNRRLSDEEDLKLNHIEAVIFGMGRMGTAAYMAIEPEFSGRIVGVDINEEKTDKHQKSGKNVITGDATNPDFWTRASDLKNGLQWVLLTLPNHNANMSAAEQLRELGYTGRIAATAKFADEEKELRSMGVSCSFNIYTEAGIGFADELKKQLHDN